ncbi:hypothetical protein TSAR_014510 [Trichomalopsis sarcophagae]|uniref:Uncharacterized protein n=1 Tax=Trichomalopsis sarcophagae TaxID=543379 RepID=A0A232F0U2_9HYME|nr:hypothetical protein TSAR_014510 [Trichomalopsis sarcophagae]
MLSTTTSCSRPTRMTFLRRGRIHPSPSFPGARFVAILLGDDGTGARNGRGDSADDFHAIG